MRRAGIPCLFMAPPSRHALGYALLSANAALIRKPFSIGLLVDRVSQALGI
ncbi:MAG TPA: hypothetical protein VLA19_04500 [Herpetosiphonaceae bacterium]|nr:hypothetical protein [Herpetosiphonaceae bacterium]